MKLKLHQLSLPGPMLARGFWLYIWRVIAKSGEEWLYVGRTGDSSSCNSQSPFMRMSQHLGQNRKSNALRHNLGKAGIDADTCRSFELTAYGPILPEARTMERHRSARDTIVGLEKELRDALEEAGYNVLNDVRSRKPVDAAFRRQVLAAMAKKFPKLSLLHRKLVGRRR